MKARIKRVVISPEVFFHILETGTTWRVKCGLPKGSRLRGMTTDPMTMNFNLFVEHEDFPEVSLEYQIAEQLEILFKKL